ncbi:hypothetical protein LLG46_14920 [bacterium]|nr:hypothetical protein [bacterium]
MKNRLIIVAMLVVITVAVYLCVRASLRTGTKWDDPASAKLKIKAINRISATEIKKITIIRSGKVVELHPESDMRYIAALLDSMKRIRVEDIERISNYKDRIVITILDKNKKEKLFILIGCFDPKCVPVISKSMRSNDLGKIVYDIYKRKDIKSRIE